MVTSSSVPLPTSASSTLLSSLLPSRPSLWRAIWLSIKHEGKLYGVALFLFLVCSCAFYPITLFRYVEAEPDGSNPRSNSWSFLYLAFVDIMTVYLVTWYVSDYRGQYRTAYCLAFFGTMGATVLYGLGMVYAMGPSFFFYGMDLYFICLSVPAFPMVATLIIQEQKRRRKKASSSSSSSPFQSSPSPPPPAVSSSHSSPFVAAPLSSTSPSFSPSSSAPQEEKEREAETTGGRFLAKNKRLDSHPARPAEERGAVGRREEMKKRTTLSCLLLSPLFALEIARKKVFPAPSPPRMAGEDQGRLPPSESLMAEETEKCQSSNPASVPLSSPDKPLQNEKETEKRHAIVQQGKSGGTRRCKEEEEKKKGDGKSRARGFSPQRSSTLRSRSTRIGLLLLKTTIPVAFMLLICCGYIFGLIPLYRASDGPMRIFLSLVVQVTVYELAAHSIRQIVIRLSNSEREGGRRKKGKRSRTSLVLFAFEAPLSLIRRFFFQNVGNPWTTALLLSLSALQEIFLRASRRSRDAFLSRLKRKLVRKAKRFSLTISSAAQKVRSSATSSTADDRSKKVGHSTTKHHRGGREEPGDDASSAMLTVSSSSSSQNHQGSLSPLFSPTISLSSRTASSSGPRGPPSPSSASSVSPSLSSSTNLVGPPRPYPIEEEKIGSGRGKSGLCVDEVEEEEEEASCDDDNAVERDQTKKKRLREVAPDAEEAEEQGEKAVVEKEEKNKIPVSWKNKISSTKSALVHSDKTEEDLVYATAINASALLEVFSILMSAFIQLSFVHQRFAFDFGYGCADLRMLSEDKTGWTRSILFQTLAAILMEFVVDTVSYVLEIRQGYPVTVFFDRLRGRDFLFFICAGLMGSFCVLWSYKTQPSLFSGCTSESDICSCKAFTLYYYRREGRATAIEQQQQASFSSSSSSSVLAASIISSLALPPGSSSQCPGEHCPYKMVCAMVLNASMGHCAAY